MEAEIGDICKGAEIVAAGKTQIGAHAAIANISSVFEDCEIMMGCTCHVSDF
jgi:hypothetical protein